MFFNSTELNVAPYSFQRDINQFTPFCVILEVDKNDKTYDKAKQLIQSFGFSFGKGGTISLLSEKFNRKRFKNKLAYVVDFRDSVDEKLDPIVIGERKTTDPLLISAIMETILDESRAIFIITDDFNNVPNCMFSRSQLGFTTKAQVVDFINKGTQSNIFEHCPSVERTTEQLNNQTLCGYSNINYIPTLTYIP